MKRTLIIQNYVKAFAFCTIVTILISCKHQPIVYTDPTITVTNPVQFMIYNNGDTVQMDINLSDEDELKDAFVYLRSDSDTFFYNNPNVFELPSFTLDTFWIVNGITVSTAGSAFVTAIASNNHNGTTTINVPITLLP